MKESVSYRIVKCKLNVIERCCYGEKVRRVTFLSDSCIIVDSIGLETVKPDVAVLGWSFPHCDTRVGLRPKCSNKRKANVK